VAFGADERVDQYVIGEIWNGCAVMVTASLDWCYLAPASRPASSLTWSSPTAAAEPQRQFDVGREGAGPPHIG
jgi:hypothetical protein